MEPTAIDLDCESRRLRVNDVTLHVQDWGGSEPTIVFAHPTGFLGAVWLPVLRRLRAREFTGRILTYDQRGHGLSSKPDEGYHWQFFVDDAVALFGMLEVRRALLVGHSAGATTLACAVAAAPQIGRGLVAIDPILFEPEFGTIFRGGDNPMAARTRTRRLVWSSRDEMLASYRAREPYSTWSEEALRDYVEHGTFQRPDGEIELLCPGRIEAQVYENSATLDVFARLAEIETDVLLVRGGRSTSFPHERAERALAALRRGRLVTVEDATHFVPMERPDEIADLVLGALEL